VNGRAKCKQQQEAASDGIRAYHYEKSDVYLSKIPSNKEHNQGWGGRSKKRKRGQGSYDSSCSGKKEVRLRKERTVHPATVQGEQKCKAEAKGDQDTNMRENH